MHQVRAGLVPMIAALREKGTAPDAAWTKGSYDVDKQAALCKQVRGGGAAGCWRIPTKRTTPAA
jgi:hypothetical protein